jgi:acetoin utilization deacetylase AcuC-like enzyme
MRRYELFMRTTGLVSDSRFRQHDPGPGHPERPERLLVLEELFASDRFRDLPRIDARAALEDEVERVHTAELLEAVADSAGRPYTSFDGDTTASAGSFEAACLAAGAAIELADAVHDRQVDSGFAALRPPGHHAERDRAMGFCLFNNVAIVARHLQARRGVERVLILDWDVHHGNGTQHSFYSDPAIMYVSLHQYPFYPGTGAADECGVGSGAGRTVNVPMPSGCSDPEYYAALRDVILPVAREFDPQFVLVSAGFDAHEIDPLASMCLSTDAYTGMTHAMTSLADECADGRLLMLLEGGYSLEALRDSVAVVLDALAEPKAFAPSEGELTPWGAATRRAMSSYWKI